MQALGRHILVECYECDCEILNDTEYVEAVMNEAARRAGATVVSSTFHHFNPHGVSGVVVIAESHLTIHTWPEYNFASVDLFTCGEECDPWRAFTYIKEMLRAERTLETEYRRGKLDTKGQPLLHKPLEIPAEEVESAAPT